MHHIRREPSNISRLKRHVAGISWTHNWLRLFSMPSPIVKQEDNFNGDNASLSMACRPSSYTVDSPRAEDLAITLCPQENWSIERLFHGTSI